MLSHNFLVKILVLLVPLIQMTVPLKVRTNQRIRHVHRTALLVDVMAQNIHLLVVLRDYHVAVLLVPRDKLLVVVHMVLGLVLGRMDTKGKRDDLG